MLSVDATNAGFDNEVLVSTLVVKIIVGSCLFFEVFVSALDDEGVWSIAANQCSFERQLCKALRDFFLCFVWKLFTNITKGHLRQTTTDIHHLTHPNTFQNTLTFSHTLLRILSTEDFEFEGMFSSKNTIQTSNHNEFLLLQISLSLDVLFAFLLTS